MGSTELLSLIALIVAGLGYYENRRSNNIQLRQAVALEESNRIALGQGAETMAAPLSAPVVFTPSRWPALVLLILLLMNLGVTGFDYYERHHSVGIAASTPSDSRDPTPKEADVIRDLAIKGSFKIAVYCLTTERDSCHYAKEWLRVLKTAGWKTGGLNETDYEEPNNGLIVCARPNSSLVGKGEFELALRENSIPVSDDCRDPALAKDINFDFALLVGGP